MEDRARVLILYHSGSGSTKMVAELYDMSLKGYAVHMSLADSSFDYKRLEEYDFIILGFPTYHAAPSESMIDFIHAAPRLAAKKKCFAFTTCGLYSGNALRIFVKLCEAKNLYICGSVEYRGPASDGALLLPAFPFMFRYQKNIADKIKADTDQIKRLIHEDSCEIRIPKFKLSSIINYPNKTLGKRYKHRLKVIEQYCSKCKKCITHCMRKCWSMRGDFPQHANSNCEFCFRCIHHCPQEAIILSKKTQKKPKLNESFYNTLREKLKG